MHLYKCLNELWLLHPRCHSGNEERSGSRECQISDSFVGFLCASRRGKRVGVLRVAVAVSCCPVWLLSKLSSRGSSLLVAFWCGALFPFFFGSKQLNQVLS